MKNRADYFDLILNVFIILIFILITYWFFELLFGGSPTLIEFGVGLILVIFGFGLKINREVGEIKVDMKHNFSRMKDDIDLIKRKLDI